MEEQVLRLLQDTTKPDTETIRRAEHGLLSLYPDVQFPFALLTIATHTNIDAGSRKAALTALKSYVSTTWSPQFDETFTGAIYLDESAKARVRDQVFGIATNDIAQDPVDNNIPALAAGVTSKIATADFPDQWPTLFPSLLNILSTSNNDAAVHGALRVLSELIDSGLSEDQFFAVARDLVNALQQIATNTNHSLIVRALSLNVFQSCFEMLEMVMGDHGQAVKAFLDESVKEWMSFFTSILKEPLPPIVQPGAGQDKQLRGVIAVKVQSVKTIDKLRKIYVSGITPHILDLFQVVWEELSRISGIYVELYVNGDADSKLVNGDGLSCSLDALVEEEIDFLQVMIKAPPVRSQLQGQIKQAGEARHTVGWLQDLLKLLVQLAQVPKEEESLWEYDANLYLSETSAVTANYTPRAACADLVVRTLGEWLKGMPVEALLHLKQQIDATPSAWKETEALLFLLGSAIKDLDEISVTISHATATTLLEQLSRYLQDNNAFVRAAAHLVFGGFFKVAGEKFHAAGGDAFANTVQSATNDESDVVRVACLNVIPDYIQALPSSINITQQQPIFGAVSEFISSHDLRDELEDADDVKSALIIALRDAMMLNPINVINSSAIDLFFTLASDGAANFVLFSLLTETFEGLVASITSNGHEPYVQLCAKTIPSLTGAFDIASMTQESALTNLAAEMVSLLAEHGSEPLPDGFVIAVMPKLQRVLMEATEAELVRPATTAVQYMLTKGTTQFLEWKDATGMSSLEVTLTIINRLLNSPDVDENAGQEVGGLASSLVNKFGADKLGPYLMELLRAVAIRLATAERIQFIQSLCMVFVELSISAPKDIVDFLSEVNINGQNGLSVVLTKWLENSVHFAGYEEVRQNVIALSKLFSLEDPRIKQIGVKGDLIVENTGRIKTRSQAKLNPDRYSTIAADLKILKLMVDELSSAANSQFATLEAANAALDAAESDDEEADGDDWEDVGDSGPGFLDLAGVMSKNELMAYGSGDEVSPTGSRVRDEATAEYLLHWFRQEAVKSQFQPMFEALSEEEQGKLRSLAS